ncbi:glycosyltransferase [Massilia sp. H6]|uniref:glycosyltransferase n=1 Tax=Massilia sp. H6 TaxID=2970464 RepID=UPI0021683D3B|nr:glycosyltransferase [Massilia sp. H6]UVW29934.1 glycosyltransferase [Massilia sp. H6]
MRKPLSIAYIVRDPLPPARADVLTLFGEEMPRHGIGSEIVGQAGGDSSAPTAWPAGAVHMVGSLGSRYAAILSPLWDLRGLLRARRRARPDCIQVRDKIASGLLGRLAAALLGLPFVYWMSFPIVEGFEVRRDQIRRQRGWRRALAWCAHAARARASRFVLYRLVLPGACHVFVQSQAMKAWLAGQGIDPARMTAVPMGVDATLFDRATLTPSADPRLEGRRVLIYLGRIALTRRSDFLLEVVAELARSVPSILLVIAGDAASHDDMAWMRAEIARRGLADHVLLTGWLAQRAALAYAVRAEVALSPIPRGGLFDVSSPTKLVEYLALGIPSVANDIPDQQLVIDESGAGLCVPMETAAFAQAVRRLLDDPALSSALARRGPVYVRRHRTYAILGEIVAETYTKILVQQEPPA